MGTYNDRKLISQRYINDAFEYHRLGKDEDALTALKEAFRLDPFNLSIKGNMAVVLADMGKKEESLKLLLEIYDKEPKNQNNLYNLGILYMERKGYKEAVKYFEEIPNINPTFIKVYNDLGLAYKNLGRYEEAELMIKKGISLDPTIPIFHNNLGNIYRGMNKFKEAAKCYETALWLNPKYAEAFGNLGSIYSLMGVVDKAEENLDEGIKLMPNLPDFYYNLAMLQKDNKKQHKAIKNFKKAASINPNFEGVWSGLYLTYRQICDWRELKEIERRLDNTEIEDTFVSVMRTESVEKNLKAARGFSSKFENLVPKNRYEGTKEKTHDRIRIGYISNDFREHPIGEMVANMFSYHDRKKFKIYAYSYGKNDGTIWRYKVEKDVDEFVDVREMTNLEAMDRIHSDEIDILVDITGFTKDNRLEICVGRPAKVQITWLGFPGTSGSNFFDYVIVDKIVLPKKDLPYYTEKAIYLPHTYQINNSAIEPSREGYSRKRMGLPEKGFIFSSFNQNYKIEPDLWKTWMNILKRVPNSYLWMWRQDEIAAKNLIKAAKKAGIKEERILFGGRLSKNNHIERLALADLGLDTKTYGGHTTTSDSLLAGVPVITMLGEHFASRVCASLLTEAGIPELIVNSLKEYEELAVSLAKNPDKLQQISEKISADKLRNNLYNTRRFVESLEKAYLKVWEYYKKGESPKTFSV